MGLPVSMLVSTTSPVPRRRVPETRSRSVTQSKRAAQSIEGDKALLSTPIIKGEGRVGDGTLSTDRLAVAGRTQHGLVCDGPAPVTWRRSRTFNASASLGRLKLRTANPLMLALPHRSPSTRSLRLQRELRSPAPGGCLSPGTLTEMTCSSRRFH